MCGNGFVSQVMGAVGKVGQDVGLIPKSESVAQTPAPASVANSQALADTQASQSANAKLAARNKRRGASLLATGAGDSGMVQSTGGKSVLGA